MDLRSFGRRLTGWLNAGYGKASGAPAIRSRTALAPLEQGFPDWSALIAKDRALWDRSLAAARTGKRVLVATNTGMHGPVVVMESLLAMALTLRGANVRFLQCDAALPACLMALSTNVAPEEMAVHGPHRVLCDACWSRGHSVYGRIELPTERLSDLIADEDAAVAAKIANTLPIEEIASYTLDGMKVGEHASAGALRYFARGTLAGELLGEPVQRRYFEAALRSALGIRRLIAREGIERAVFHHGIYTPQGLVTEACRTAGVPLSTWVVAYRKNSFIFSHSDTYHHTLMDEPVDAWTDMPWSDEHEAAIMSYLESRAEGSKDWIYFHEAPDRDVSAFAERIGLDPTKPTIGLLTNVVWDAQLHYPANAFASMIDWVLTSIAYFAKRPDLQLLIRVHPAEVRGTVPSRQRIIDEIAQAYPDLPKNVFIIGPEDPLSTYAAMAECNAALVFGTKMGVELTSIGMPVIVAGEAWIRNKGLTLDARSVADYIALLDKLPLSPVKEHHALRRARMYAYHFFFRRMIPLPFMKPNGTGAMFDVDISSLEELLPGRSKGLDVICEGILNETPFIYPAETQGLHV